VGHSKTRFIFLALAVLLGGCAAAETRSIVDTASLPSKQYRSIAIFLENFDEADRPLAEAAIQNSFQTFSIRVASGVALFEGRQLDDPAKAKLIQKDFDAVLYVRTSEKGITEQRMENLVFNGEDVIYVAGGIPWYSLKTDHYIIKPDGSVYKPIIAAKLKSDLQDTKTNLQVWSSETIVTGDADKFGNPGGVSGLPVDYSTMLVTASKQIVEKMHGDHII
jgi:hypothetical protein